MKYEYQVKMVDLSQVNAECNAMGQQSWDLATAYPSARRNCCNDQVQTVILIFKRPA